MNKQLPDDSMTYRELQDYEAKRSGILKRGYDIGEVDNLFGRAVYILKMYEEGNFIDPRIGGTLTAEKVAEYKFPRNNNGYEMKEVNVLIDRIVLALKYWEKNRDNGDFGLKQRKPKFRKVRFNGKITEMDITGLSEEELNEVEVIDEPQDSNEGTQKLGFFGSKIDPTHNTLENEDDSPETEENPDNDDTSDLDIDEYLKTEENNTDEDEELPDVSAYIEEADEHQEGENSDELSDIEEVELTDSEEEPDEDEELFMDEVAEEEPEPTEDNYFTDDTITTEEELVEEPAPQSGPTVFSRMESNRKRPEELYLNTTVKLPADWKNYVSKPIQTSSGNN